MAAPLGPALVLELDRRGTGLLEPPHAVGHRVGAAEARVGIDDQRDFDRGSEEPRLGLELVEREDADVGHAEDARRKRSPREIDGLEPLALDEFRGQRDRSAGNRHHAIGDEPAQDGAAGTGGKRVGRGGHRWYPAGEGRYRTAVSL